MKKRTFLQVGLLVAAPALLLLGQNQNFGNNTSTSTTAYPGAVTATSFGANGSAAGDLYVVQNTTGPASLPGNSVNWVAPQSVTAYMIVPPGTAASGYWLGTLASTASATVTTGGGQVTGSSGLSGGSGYVQAPPCVISTTGSGTGATCITTISGGAVNNIVITNGGSGYTSGTTTFSFGPQLVLTYVAASGNGTQTATASGTNPLSGASAGDVAAIDANGNLEYTASPILPNATSFLNLTGSGNGSHIQTHAATKDISGTCTMTAGACSAITFSTSYTAEPACVGSWDGQTGTLSGILKMMTTTSGITPTSTVGTDTAKIFYVCLGNPS
jgi:hypothetical protein